MSFFNRWLVMTFWFVLPLSVASATIAHTAHGGATAGVHNASAISVTVTAAAGDSIFVFCGVVGAGSCSVPTDNASPTNTYTASAAILANNLLQIYYVLNPVNLPTTVTCNLSGAEGDCIVETYTGVTAIGANHNGSGTSAAPAITVTTTAANSWVLFGGEDTVATATSAWSATTPNEIWHSVNSASTGGIVTIASGDGGNFTAAGSHTVTVALSVSETWGSVGVELQSVAQVCNSNLVLMGAGCK